VIDLFANRAGRPLGITIRAPGFAGSADIAAVPLTPTALARLTHVGRPLSTEHGHRL
jgi:hypothetical protein